MTGWLWWLQAVAWAGDVSPTPLWEAVSPEGAAWTQHVLQELPVLGPEILDGVPADMADFCPRYPELTVDERSHVWAYLLSAMARYESNFSVSSAYTENFTDAAGDAVISRGLLQISLESSQGYDCGFTSAEQLHDPFHNLSCGIRILNRWIGQDRRISGKVDGKWKGGSRYWAVLRDTREAYAKVLARMEEVAICQ